MEQESPNQPWITVARLIRPQGRKGEVLAELLTDFPDRLNGGRKVHLASGGSKSDSATPRALEILSSWLPHGKNEGRIVLHFAAVDTIEAAELLCGMEVVITRHERAPLEAGEIYVSDLNGCNLFDQDRLVGVVRDVQFPSTPDGKRRLENGVPILSVDTANGDELLIPFAKDLVVSWDVEEKRLDMKLPAGLLDLNLA